MSSLALKPAALSRASATAVDEGARINYLNAGLIVVSFVVALFIPFELFLFAYAILGPGHYLTEISWLHKRQFFAKKRYDGPLLAALALVPLLMGLGKLEGALVSGMQAGVVVFGLGCGLVFLLTETVAQRIGGLALVVAVTWLSTISGGQVLSLFSLFVPTLIHVYVFTGLFMLYGALKARSRSGYISVGLFVLCPLLYLIIRPDNFVPSQYTVLSYWQNFSTLNKVVLGVSAPKTQLQMDQNVLRVFHSPQGLMLMRFVAFAYTYHYLNWFSKTSIIKWHEVPKQRLGILAAVWLGTIAIYLYGYNLGVQVMFLLSYLHVFLEFPLNHLSIIGTAKELPAALGFSWASAGSGRG